MKCEDCDKELVGKRVDARFCDDLCKKRWQRKQKPPGKRGRPPKNPDNELAREIVLKRVKVAKPVVEPPKPPPATVFSLLKSKLAKKDTRGPVQAKKQPAKGKGGIES